jgi:hypothetical protein
MFEGWDSCCSIGAAPGITRCMMRSGTKANAAAISARQGGGHSDGMRSDVLPYLAQKRTAAPERSAAVAVKIKR